MSRPPKHVPTPGQRAWHSGIVMSPRQAERMQRGTLESRPTDYGTDRSVSRDCDRAAARARQVLEDRRIMRALGLDEGA